MTNAATARAWLPVLASSDVLYWLPPCHRNFGKRLVKAPKLYFVDTGLACWPLGIRLPEQLALHPARGALFENGVVSEFVKNRNNLGQAADLFFGRDNNGPEADLLYENGTGQLRSAEIKTGQTPTGDCVRAGLFAASMAGHEACTPLLIYGGDLSVLRNGVQLLGWRMLARKD